MRKYIALGIVLVLINFFVISVAGAPEKRKGKQESEQEDKHISGISRFLDKADLNTRQGSIQNRKNVKHPIDIKAPTKAPRDIRGTGAKSKEIQDESNNFSAARIRHIRDDDEGEGGCPNCN
eukprot:TRINITY_DN4566_c0_g1_i3.p1 TRINITY_DN4566_c0_g1~~TRINITY_DN4566_c0_g1_i3.p1  ORF type:complete len:122 (+),score=16.64 TRINITY_DN4566_c0_g1_i3:25-390(+)